MNMSPVSTSGRQPLARGHLLLRRANIHRAQQPDIRVHNAESARLAAVSSAPVAACRSSCSARSPAPASPNFGQTLVAGQSQGHVLAGPARGELVAGIAMASPRTRSHLNGVLRRLRSAWLGRKHGRMHRGLPSRMARTGHEDSLMAAGAVLRSAPALPGLTTPCRRSGRKGIMRVLS